MFLPAQIRLSRAIPVSVVILIVLRLLISQIGLAPWPEPWYLESDR